MCYTIRKGQSQDARNTGLPSLLGETCVSDILASEASEKNRRFFAAQPEERAAQPEERAALPEG